MARGALSWAMLLLLLACTATTPLETGDTGEVTVDTGEPAPVDHDQDGWDETEDCNDLDPDVFPGADEVEWNGVDDDCDGRVDANGLYTGIVGLTARVTYEGTPRIFDEACPATLDRAGSRVDLEVVCTPDPADELAVLLLGETLTIVEEDNRAADGEWSGATRVISSSGWDVRGSGSLGWTDLDHVDLALALDTVSLDFSGAGTLTWTP